MIENIIYRKSANDQVIIDFLRGKRISYEELLKQAKKWEKEGLMTYQTFRRRYKKLIKLGIIIEPLIELTKPFEGANPEEVMACIKIIEKEDNKDILLGRIKQLRIISKNFRTVHIPRVIFVLEKILDKPIIFNNEDIFEQYCLLLVNILDFERENKSPDSEKFVGELINSLFEKLIKILNEKQLFPNLYAIQFLGLSGKKKSIDILFKKIRQFGDKLGTHQIDNLAYAIVTENLYKNHQKLINEKIDELIREGNESLKRNLTDLRETILHKR